MKDREEKQTLILKRRETAKNSGRKQVSRMGGGGSCRKAGDAKVGQKAELYGGKLKKPVIITVTWHKPEATAEGK